MDEQFSGAPRAPIDAIEIGIRMRATNPRQVAALKDSIHAIGLLNPISVCLLSEAKAEKIWGLIAGAHRLEACRSLGHRDIPIHVVSLSELRREIAECDENLCGPKLTPAERAILTARRKQAYEAIYPKTRNGASGNGRKKLCKIGEAPRFTADTAARTGKSERSIQRDAERGSKISTKILQEVRHTKMDNGRSLDVLTATPLEDQPAKVFEMLRMPRESAKQKPHNGEATPTQPADKFGSSEAAVWLLARLGSADSRLFLSMLAKEDLVTFHTYFQTITQLSDPPGPALNPGGHVPENIKSSDCSDTLCLGSEIGTGILLVSDTPELDDGPVTFYQVASGLEEAVITRHNPRRPSNWGNVSDEPQDGDWCRECQATNWWVSTSERSGWWCAGCFDPPSRRLLRSTAPAHR